ncbi:MAG: choice-of-anchor Q domain-containing protein [Betaproteobacteria bacterium]
MAAPVQWTIASGGNDHWYEFIYASAGFTWEQAQVAAAGSSHLGMPGYLATVTSQAENDFIYALAKYPGGATGIIFDPANPNVSLGPIDISGKDASTWLGGTDSATEGTWRWINGPETGTVFWIGDGTTGSAPAGKFARWDNAAGGDPTGNEPNASTATEDFLQLRYTAGRWNDSASATMLTLPGFIPPANVNRIRAPAAYIVEYSPATAPLTFTVTNLNDSGVGSLRDAVVQANQAPGPNTINFQAGLTGTILLTSGSIAISDALTIVGPGAGVITVDGNASSRVFVVFENVADVCATPGVDFPVSISGLTITNGLRNVASSSGGAIYAEKSLTLTNVVVSNSNAFAGGGLGYNMTYSGQSLTIANSQFLNNVARPLSTTTGNSDGGGLRVVERCGVITSSTTIAITNSVFSGNQTQPGATFLGSAGGGIHIGQTADITITDTRIVGNSVVNQNPAVPGASNRGGGLSVDDGKTLRIERSEISGNFANRAGGLRFVSDLPARQVAGQEFIVTIVNSTISGNGAAQPLAGGAGMVAYGNVALTLDNSTVYNNSSPADAAGAMILDVGVTNPVSASNTLPPTVVLQSSIVAGSLNGAPDIGVNDEVALPAITVNASKSLIGSVEPIVTVTGAGNLLGVNPLLGPLAFNGGTSRTHAVLAGSPVLNTGSNPLALTNDQRGAGFPRVATAVADMGSFESSGPVAPPATFVVTNLNDSGAGSLRDAIGQANNALGPNTVAFAPGLTGTILLTSGVLRITDALTIVGPGAGTLTIDGNAANRMFAILGPDPACPAIDGPDFLVSISGLRLTNGRRTQSNTGGAIYSAHSLVLDSMMIDHNTAAFGGGVVVASQYPGMSVTISNTQFQNNTVQPLAGAANVLGGALALIERCTGIRTTPYVVDISNSGFSGNLAQPVTLGGFGGAIYSTTNADITITDTRIVDNHVNAPNPPVAGQNYQGGGFYGTARSFTLIRSEISGNSVFDVTGSDQTRSGGLHLFNSAPDLQGAGSEMVVKLINSTVSGNQVSATGGAMIAFGNVDLELDNTTVSDNVAAPTRTGGIIMSTGATNPASASNATAPTLTLVSAILANNSSDGGDLASNLATIPLLTVDATNSLIEKMCPSPSCEISVVGTGNLLGTDPQLGPLGFNGGTTRTHVPQAGSPVINAGSNPLGLATDQRGGAFARVVGAAADMGSFEVGSAVPAPVFVNARSRKVHGGLPNGVTYDLPLVATPLNPTTEPRMGPTHTIVFTFDKAVSAGNASVTEGVATAGAPTFSGNEMRVPLTLVSNQQYVTVAVSSVVAVDGGSGGTGSVRAGFLAGDVNQNRVVSLADLGLVNAQVAQVVTAANYLKDINASNTLSLADKGLTNAQLTKALPAP